MSLGRQPARAGGAAVLQPRGLSSSDPKHSGAGPSPAEAPVRRSLAGLRLLTPKLGDTNRVVAFAATTFVVTRVMCSVENGSAGQAPQPAGCGRDTRARSALHAREGAERGAKGLRWPPGPRVPRARVGGSRGSPLPTRLVVLSTVAPQEGAEPAPHVQAQQHLAGTRLACLRCGLRPQPHPATCLHVARAPRPPAPSPCSRTTHVCDACLGVRVRLCVCTRVASLPGFVHLLAAFQISGQGWLEKVTKNRVPPALRIARGQPLFPEAKQILVHQHRLPGPAGACGRSCGPIRRTRILRLRTATWAEDR